MLAILSPVCFNKRENCNSSKKFYEHRFSGRGRGTLLARCVLQELFVVIIDLLCFLAGVVRCS